MNDIDYDAYMEFWRDSIDNGTLKENNDTLEESTDSLSYVKYDDAIVAETPVRRYA